MPKLPDVSGYSFDELSKLVASATKRIEEIRGKRIKELQAELGRLGVDGAPAPRSARKNAQTDARSGGGGGGGGGGEGGKKGGGVPGARGAEKNGGGGGPHRG